MQNGYYNAVGGMVTSFNRLDVVSNNLANLNTSSYKQNKVIIGDYMQFLDEKRDIMPLENHTVEGSRFLNRTYNRVPQVVEEWTNFSIGSMKHTENKLDVAINKKNIFFAIKDEDGQINLSRNGSFAINAENKLVSKVSGGFVLGSDGNPITLNGRDVVIDNNGNVYLDKRKLENGLQIYEVSNLKYLEKLGNGNYKPLKEGIHKPIANSDAIQQGFIEGSNVSPILAMTNLIAVNRSIEMSQKAMTTQMDDMNNEAINKIANVKN